MKNLKKYSINFASLADGEHQFTYHLDKSFLENFENSLIDDADVTVEVTLMKHGSMLELEFDLQGTIPAICDTCAEDFQLSIDAYEELIVKFVSVLPEEEDMSTEVMYLEYGSTSLDLAHQLYEILILAIPISKHHEEDENGEPTCNPETLAALKKLSGEHTEKNSKKGNDAEKRSDNSIWDILKDLN